MATATQKQNAVSSKSQRSKVRTPYFASAKHLSDNYTNLGYDYRGKILSKTTSSELWANPIQKPLFAQIEAILTFILEQVKYIKKTMSIAHGKEDTNIN
ncbi:MAG TPA: hypothetical protein PLP47_06150 [Methanofastidiosum sp.]|jgi:hypothetical protein|nr:hypothetical protein [Methanofastidiosum sp.]